VTPDECQLSSVYSRHGDGGSVRQRTLARSWAAILADTGAALPVTANAMRLAGAGCSV
jgi:hypothetical protein